MHTVRAIAISQTVEGNTGIQGAKTNNAADGSMRAGVVWGVYRA